MPAPSKPSILVTDDDPIFLAVLRSRLEAAGYDVGTAENGLDAQEALARKPYQLLVTDILMPRCDGIQLITTVRPQYPALKIIAMTSGGPVANDHYLARATQAGAHAGLEKPFPREVFLATVTKLLGAA